MAVYGLPAFPIMVGIRSSGSTVGAPRVTVEANLAYGKRVMTQYWDWSLSGENAVFANLLLPALTDIRDYSSTTGSDSVECPVGSGRFYLVDYVDDLGKGFPNEHRFALMEKLIPWPTPIP